MEPSESYKQVNYELRPAKQVERRMLIDGLQLLAEAGLPIRDYQYTGMGSVYYVDFILLHKFLGISKMLSAESMEGVENRVNFNKPYDFVDVKMESIGDAVTGLQTDHDHLVWMDYDLVLYSDILRDVFRASAHLPMGSILLVTVDVEPPGTEEDGPEHWHTYFEKESGHYFEPSWTQSDFTRSKLPRRNIDLIACALSSGISERREGAFYPLFSFSYADGHEMITLGGLIGGRQHGRIIKKSQLSEEAYYRPKLQQQEPYRITVPNVTRKERLYLDSNMPCQNDWTPEDFEMEWDDVKAYREIYRFFPPYAELLM